MTEFLKRIVANILNPKGPEPKHDLKYELQVKFNRSLYLKEYLKTKAWIEYERPKIEQELESGIRRLLVDGIPMDEAGLKAVLSYMKSITDRLNDMRNAINIGEEAGIKLEKMK